MKKADTVKSKTKTKSKRAADKGPKSAGRLKKIKKSQLKGLVGGAHWYRGA